MGTLRWLTILVNDVLTLWNSMLNVSSYNRTASRSRCFDSMHNGATESKEEVWFRYSRKKSDTVCVFLVYFCAVLWFLEPPYTPLIYLLPLIYVLLLLWSMCHLLHAGKLRDICVLDRSQVEIKCSNKGREITHSIDMLCTSLGGKHGQNPSATANIKDNFVTKQMPVVIHCIAICCCAYFILDHFLLKRISGH